MITDRTLERAWEAWSRVWDPKDRDKEAFRFALKDKLDDDQFKEAARLALSECRFFPTPYDIAKLAPPPKKAFAKASVPSGFAEFGSIDTGILKTRFRSCERLFGEVGGASVWAKTVKRLIAIQYLKHKEELKLRESYQEVNDGTQHGSPCEPGLFGTKGGAVEHVREEEVRSMGMRPDGSPAGIAAAFGAGVESGKPVHEDEEDDGDTGVGLVDGERDTRGPAWMG